MNGNSTPNGNVNPNGYMKPRVGLVLGSGAARGWAHIGVIEELSSMGIEADVVAGCSVGALVGAAYCAGEIETLDRWVRQLRMLDVVSFMDLTFKTGFVDARRLFEFFQQRFGDINIEELPKRYATAATELMTGREVWFKRGPLIPAIKASSALPGLFAPIEIDHKYLVDGGLVNPVPVSLARALGAELVIAVNLNAEIIGKRLRKKMHEIEAEPEPPVEENVESNFIDKVSDYFSSNGKRTPPGMMEVMATSINIMQDRITRSRMAGDPAEILITPRLAHFGMMEFNRAAEAIEEGRLAVRRSLAQLQSYGLVDTDESEV